MVSKRDVGNEVVAANPEMFNSIDVFAWVCSPLFIPSCASCVGMNAVLW